MQNFWVYGELGFFHVLDPQGYDHVLFLTALALPFTYRSWKRVFWLATLFTISHCLSLALAAYGVVDVDAAWVEFLIPVTILLTALFNLFVGASGEEPRTAFRIHLISTGLFGLIHGLGFSNYFRMLMMGETEKNGPLLGFALGIEAAQLLVLVVVLGLSYFLVERLRAPAPWYIRVGSLVIAAISLGLLVGAWPA
ncbi:HupE/UreJ family protein [Robiginitalea sp. SC105]|uniref:HupE/UreJ family protein n=1 Tax=Robiginitalea sp. SC105 TaxID=2762332 RepID=UPI00163AB62C|nr:HupE/UreJ family protein [Robiginitalea sp. SC105]MBC2838379.1 HupE/UreJ family protein [Robiginitalea sp. SC105]